MKIKKIHIDNFGKFENYDLELTDGMNVIYGQNEDGKSTLMAFILMMFYGFSGRSKDLSKNLRERYKPWNGQEMKGYILFEHKGIQYRLERVFGKSNSSDKVKIMDDITGEVLKYTSSKDPGQEFFGLGEEAFSKSVFIGQGGVVLDASGKKDEITEKLMNLVTTGNEDLSYKAAMDTIVSSMESLVSKSKKQGTLVKAMEEVSRLKEEKIAAEQDEQDKKLALRDIGETKEELRKEVDREKLLKDRLSVRDDLVEKEKLEEALSREKKLLEAEEKAEVEKKKLMTATGILTRKDLENLKGLLNLQEDEERDLKKEEERLRNLKQELIRLEEDTTVKKVAKDILDGQKEKETELLKIRKDKVELLSHKKHLEEMENSKEKRTRLLQKYTQIERDFLREKSVWNTKKEDITHLEEDKNHLKSRIEDQEKAVSALELQGAVLEEKIKSQVEREESLKKEGEKRILEIKARMKEVENPRRSVEEKNRTKGGSKGMLVAAVLLGLISVVMGILLESYYFAGILLAGVLGILSRKNTVSSKISRSTEQDLTAFYEEEIRKTENDTEEKLAQIIEARVSLEKELKEKSAEIIKTKETLETLEGELKAVQVHVRKLEEEVSDKALRVARLEESLQAAEKDLKEEEELHPDEDFDTLTARKNELLQLILEKEEEEENLTRDLKESFQRYGVETYESLLGLYHQYQGYLEKIAELKRKIETDAEKIETTRTHLETSQDKVLTKLSLWKPVENLTQASELLQEVEETLAGYERLQNHAEYLRNERKPLEKSMSGEELLLKKNTLERKIRDLLGKEVISEEDLQGIRQGEEELEKLQNRITDLREEIARKETELKEKYRHRKNLSQIEDELAFYTEKVVKRQKIYDALTVAKDQMEQSFSELQRSFGPKVNEKTEEIFHRLTNGKYRKVRVTKEFSISFEDPVRRNSYEWGFLSGGTIDQVYLSLRLAISDLMSGEEENLPIFLDDVFTQYDDDRACEGLKFLREYAMKKEDPVQVVLFTCHRRLSEWARDIEGIALKEIRKSS